MKIPIGFVDKVFLSFYCHAPDGGKKKWAVRIGSYGFGEVPEEDAVRSACLFSLYNIIHCKDFDPMADMSELKKIKTIPLLKRILGEVESAEVQIGDDEQVVKEGHAYVIRQFARYNVYQGCGRLFVTERYPRRIFQTLSPSDKTISEHTFGAEEWRFNKPHPFEVINKSREVKLLFDSIAGQDQENKETA